jgi:hypothetical protein
VKTRVFKPGLVQGPGFRVLTGLPGSISIFFKNQNDIILVLKKKQKSTGCNRVFDQVLSGHQVNQVTPGFDFPYFFLNQTQFQPQIGRVPG